MLIYRSGSLSSLYGVSIPLRGVFDSAMRVYLNRFLNVPSVPLPKPTTTKKLEEEKMISCSSNVDICHLTGKLGGRGNKKEKEKYEEKQKPLRTIVSKGFSS
jgi:hypothetical protein